MQVLDAHRRYVEGKVDFKMYEYKMRSCALLGHGAGQLSDAFNNGTYREAA